MSIERSGTFCWWPRQDKDMLFYFSNEYIDLSLADNRRKFLVPTKYYWLWWIWTK